MIVAIIDLVFQLCRSHGPFVTARGHGVGHAGFGASVQFSGTGASHLRLSAAGVSAEKRLRRA